MKAKYCQIRSIKKKEKGKPPSTRCIIAKFLFCRFAFRAKRDILQLEQSNFTGDNDYEIPYGPQQLERFRP